MFEHRRVFVKVVLLFVIIVLFYSCPQLINFVVFIFHLKH